MSARLKAAPAKHRNNPLTAPTVYSLNRMADLCLDLKDRSISARRFEMKLAQNLGKFASDVKIVVNA